MCESGAVGVSGSARNAEHAAIGVRMHAGVDGGARPTPVLSVAGVVDKDAKRGDSRHLLHRRDPRSGAYLGVGHKYHFRPCGPTSPCGICVCGVIRACFFFKPMWIIFPGQRGRIFL